MCVSTSLFFKLPFRKTHPRKVKGFAQNLPPELIQPIAVSSIFQINNSIFLYSRSFDCHGRPVNLLPGWQRVQQARVQTLQAGGPALIPSTTQALSWKKPLSTAKHNLKITTKINKTPRAKK